MIDSRYPGGEPVHRLLADSNARVLHRILLSHGWPGYGLVGVEGAEAALRIALDAEPVVFLRTLLRILDSAVRRGDAPQHYRALLLDRFCVREGLPQRYGTHVRPGADGGCEVWPVEDPVLLPVWRAEVGLPLLPSEPTTVRIAGALDGEPRILR
ncbi:DUF6624 domain-containing protein [Streptomyces sp. NPDC005953]|uniref:DUF6624 domain-containing protein n=1 Tax=Streptomyces sp. NPDC005953 TaxID=3156719 RepID=UPI0033D5663D